MELPLPPPSVFPSAPLRTDLLSALIQVGQIPPAELELRLQELRRLSGPFPAREDLVKHINLSRGRVPWAFNSYSRQVVTAEITALQGGGGGGAGGNSAVARPGPSLAGSARSIPTAPLPLFLATVAEPTPASASASVSALTLQDSHEATESRKEGEEGERIEEAIAVIFSPLPDELQDHIFTFLDTITLAKVSMVCRQWHRLSTRDLLWKKRLFLRWSHVTEATFLQKVW